MKSNMNQFKWMRGFGNASYIIGIAFLIASLLVSAIPSQAADASDLKCILGCTDKNAINYNKDATQDDGSCMYVWGCTDKHATNYNKDATKDDGSCTYVIPGCTDKNATNYNKDATKDDGTCTYDIPGCTDKNATNYNKDATKDDGSCTYDIPGCTDKNATNYNKDATKDDGTCTYDILGCTDKNATNYNKDATKDDGTCTYEILGCTDKNATNFNKDATKDDGTCTYEILGCTDKNATNYNKDATKDDGTCTYPPPDYKLNLSHIECVEGSVEIHFVLLNVPDGITPGTLTYTYGTISPSKDTGNVWHYSDYKADGYYDVTNASVDVGGTTVSLHNPGEYKGNYTCSSPPPPCSYDPSIPADDPLCLPCQWNPQIPADDPACFKPCEWNPQIPADDPACFKPCEWNPNIPAGETTCKPSVSFGSCYNPIKGLFELKVVNKDVVGYYIGYDVYGESGIYNLGYFNAGESKSFDVPLLNGNNDTLRKYASLTGGEPWTAAGGTHVFDPNTENVCEYDPARVEVSCNPYVDQKLTWTIYNDNNYPLDYFWTWSISSEPGGMGNVAALSSGSFATEYKPATMQIRLGSLQFYIEPEDCKIPPKDKTPTQPPRITPTVKVRTVAPPVVTPEILIPVTGVDLSSGGNLKMTLVNLGLAFLGLGLVLNGFARSRKDWDI